ncbi:protein phosphatase 1 regulatory subunit 1C-like isoform X2 [Osmerus eperlanus]|uniref:protein phosphatase 1 regulatory subunit 1C-like isoform X2 n=1 Tax=Osmerus eperlanus TaxID=29151 RepID=UPI002E11E785
MEPSSPKKIQFSVPPLQNQLDPQAAEHIRRRRPTPATLLTYQDLAGEVEDKHAASGVTDGSNVSQRNQSYAPPTIKDLQQHLQRHEQPEAGFCENSPIATQHFGNTAQWANHNGPDEPNGNEAYLLLANEELALGESGKLTKPQTERSLPEEEEGGATSQDD